MSNTTAPVVKVDETDDTLLKHVNAVALMPTPGGRRISLLGRRIFNVLLYRSQEEGEQEEYQARLQEILDISEYGSNETAHVKKVLKELLTTTVEWQSPSTGEIETWDSCNLLSGVGLTKDKKTGAVTVRWRFDSKVRGQLLSPDRYARLSIEAITQLSSHSAMALYEICARYVDNPGKKTARQHWKWWKPVLTGINGDDSKAEYRFFKRDVINKAIAEINERTNIEVRGPIEHKERDNKTVGEIQFEVSLKGHRLSPLKKKPLHSVSAQDLPVIGRAISAGVEQEDAENLIRKHGADSLANGIAALESRLQMPVDVVGPVRKPGSWLKENMERKGQQANEVASYPDAIKVSSEDLKKRKAVWVEAWLRERKLDIQRGFEELGEVEQQEFLTKFRAQLVAGNVPHFVKRFDTSGWQHAMLKDSFIKFFGSEFIGRDWFKPSDDEILSIAASMG